MNTHSIMYLRMHYTNCECGVLLHYPLVRWDITSASRGTLEFAKLAISTVLVIAKVLKVSIILANSSVPLLALVMSHRNEGIRSPMIARLAPYRLYGTEWPEGKRSFGREVLTERLFRACYWFAKLTVHAAGSGGGGWEHLKIGCQAFSLWFANH